MEDKRGIFKYFKDEDDFIGNGGNYFNRESDMEYPDEASVALIKDTGSILYYDPSNTNNDYTNTFNFMIEEGSGEYNLRVNSKDNTVTKGTDNPKEKIIVDITKLDLK